MKASVRAKVERAAQQRQGYQKIPLETLRVTRAVAAHVMGIDEAVVDKPIRTVVVIQTRQIRDQLLLEVGYREPSIAQDTGRDVCTVVHSVRRLEERAERGTPAFGEVQRARRLLRARGLGR